jgi:hypothetical protein
MDIFKTPLKILLLLLYPYLGLVNLTDAPDNCFFPQQFPLMFEVPDNSFMIYTMQADVNGNIAFGGQSYTEG